MAMQSFEFDSQPPQILLDRSAEFLAAMQSRRSIRTFSSQAVPRGVIENVVKTAASAPSGANKQPWKFVIVEDPSIKKRIRDAAEQEEKAFYSHRASEAWLKDLEPFETDWHKEFLETAPYLIVVFKQTFDNDHADRKKNYYVNESVGIATGFLLAAIHQAGLVSLTHTPVPMHFLQTILKSPTNEKPYLLIPVGYPAEGTQVPAITKKTFEDVAEFV